jgi:hypothetical protein
VLKPGLIAVFIGVVTAGILIVGYLFNLLPLHDIVAAGHSFPRQSGLIDELSLLQGHTPDDDHVFQFRARPR